MTQVIRPPGEPIDDCPVCGSPYYDYEEKSTCIGVGLTKDLEDDAYCTKTGQSYYVTEYYIHERQ